MRRCCGDGPSGTPPHFTDPKKFSKDKTTGNRRGQCKDCNKIVNTRRNPRTNADPKYDPARARARERRQQLEERAWIEPGWNKPKSLAFWGRRCYICGQEIEGLIHYDHVIPVTKGGEWSVANVRPTHEPCNLWKSDTLLQDLDWSQVPLTSEQKCGIMYIEGQKTEGV